MIKISGYDSHLIDDIVKFRRDAYLNSGRDPSQTDAWSRDEFDSTATHVLTYNEEGQIIGAVRIIDGDKWTIEHYFDYDYDKQHGVEFGRLAITQPSYQGKRVLAELIKAACHHCAEGGKTHIYGFVISRLKRELQRLGVPFEVLSPSSAPMGEESALIRFRIDELLRF
jgi:N-acyl-L-homoserine lactone synthetase